MRSRVKRGLALAGATGRPRGATVLIYHRVGGGSRDERDLPLRAFAEQLDVLQDHDVVSLDAALERVARGNDRPCVVLTFDDGFADVHAHAWPLLRSRGMPFTLYLSTAYVGGRMHWPGSTATAPGPGLDRRQVDELASSGLCTVGNHTHTHCRPEHVDDSELDTCSALVEQWTGTAPVHFAWTWGMPDAATAPLVRSRFASAASGHAGRHTPGADPMELPRIPVRGSDPLPYFRAVVGGGLAPVYAYERTVRVAKRLGARA